VELRARPPYDWPGLHRFFCQRAIPGVEACADGRYQRTIEVGGRAGTVTVGGDVERSILVVGIDVGGTGPSEVVTRRLRTMFDVDADPAAIGETLAADPALAPLVAARPGLRVPGCWDPFELVVRAVLGQQITVAAARTLAGRLVARFGRELDPDGGPFLFPSPTALAEADVGAIGLPRRRAETLRAVARAVATGGLVLDPGADRDTSRAQLLAIPGIGEWTADYVALRALRDADAFPAGDLGLVRAAKRLGIAETPADLRTASQAWRPWRAYAALHLWQSLGDTTVSRDDRGGR